MTDRPPPGSTVEQVLPGNTDDLDRLAGVLDNYVDGAIDATRHLRALDFGGWVGEAADAFWSSVEDILKRLDEAAVAFEEASFALRSYSGTLREAQADVRRALTSSKMPTPRPAPGWRGTPTRSSRTLRRPSPGVRHPSPPKIPENRSAARPAPSSPRRRNGRRPRPSTPPIASTPPPVTLPTSRGSGRGAGTVLLTLASGGVGAAGKGAEAGEVAEGLAAAGESAEAIKVTVAVEELTAAERGASAPASLSELTAKDLVDRTPEELRNLAREKGFEPHGQPDADGNFREFRDPGTKRPRLRIDQGHVDPTTGLPYNDPRAAIPHAHGYDPDGKPIVDPGSGNKHFPLKERFSE